MILYVLGIPSPSRLIESLRGLGVGSAATCVSSFVSSSLSFVTRSSLSTVRARMWRSVVRGWAGRAGSPVWTRALDPITCRAAAPARSAAVHLAGMQTIQPDLASLWDRASAGLLTGGLLAGLLAPVAALCAGDDDAQLPASGADEGHFALCSVE